jgi:ABC-type antimicrobial peptide transport system permease subunit
MEVIVSEAMASTSFTMTLLGIAATVALLLGAIGLFGVISYVVSQRTREIGVRVALGARGEDVQRMIVRQGVGVLIGGVVLGLGGAFALTRLMGAILYEVSATDPWTFAGAPVLLVLVSLLASWLPARRATKVDPVEALRAE